MKRHHPIKNEDAQNGESDSSGAVSEEPLKEVPEGTAVPDEGGKAGVEESPEALLDRAVKEAKENYDRFLRVSAEFENFKKRMAREKEDHRKYANETLLKALLPVVDNLERAIEAAGTESLAEDPFVKGVKLTLAEILKVFETFSVRPISALREPFDPVYHQAVMQEASDTHPDNTVVQELQKGYLIHDRLLRPAMVVVSKGSGKPNAPNDKNTSKNI